MQHAGDHRLIWDRRPGEDVAPLSRHIRDGGQQLFQFILRQAAADELLHRAHQGRDGDDVRALDLNGADEQAVRLIGLRRGHRLRRPQDRRLGGVEGLLANGGGDLTHFGRRIVRPGLRQRGGDNHDRKRNKGRAEDHPIMVNRFKVNIL